MMVCDVRHPGEKKNTKMLRIMGLFQQDTKIVRRLCLNFNLEIKPLVCLLFKCQVSSFHFVS